jgi:hypothetical protein
MRKIPISEVELALYVAWNSLGVSLMMRGSLASV